MSIDAATLARLEAKLDKTSSDTGCWLWTGARTRGGYGNFAIGRKAHRVPRVMLHLTLGLDLYGPWVARHTCDTPECCNPRHLVAGTQQQNVDDMWERGRGVLGERMNVSKLTEHDVKEIRRRDAAGESSYKIAESYPVCYEQVRRIVTRKTWSWL